MDMTFEQFKERYAGKFKTNEEYQMAYNLSSKIMDNIENETSIDKTVALAETSWEVTEEEPAKAMINSYRFFRPTIELIFSKLRLFDGEVAFMLMITFSQALYTALETKPHLLCTQEQMGAFIKSFDNYLAGRLTKEVASE